MKYMIGIWNNAYSVYANGDYALMWDYFREQINNGNLSYEYAETMAEDIVEIYNL